MVGTGNERDEEE